jgi:hypothetical protein
VGTVIRRRLPIGDTADYQSALREGVNCRQRYADGRQLTGGAIAPKGFGVGELAFWLYPNAPIGGPDFRRQAGGKT